MAFQNSFHAVSGLDFLGLRKARCGGFEIVYDGGAAKRMVWRVAADQAAVTESALSDVLRVAVDAPQIVPRMLHEMKKRAVLLESV
jgi:hypothetical protein